MQEFVDRSLESSFCSQGLSRSGSFASVVVKPNENLLLPPVNVPLDVRDEEALRRNNVRYVDTAAAVDDDDGGGFRADEGQHDEREEVPEVIGMQLVSLLPAALALPPPFAIPLSLVSLRSDCVWTDLCVSNVPTHLSDETVRASLQGAFNTRAAIEDVNGFLVEQKVHPMLCGNNVLTIRIHAVEVARCCSCDEDEDGVRILTLRLVYNYYTIPNFNFCHVPFADEQANMRNVLKHTFVLCVQRYLKLCYVSTTHAPGYVLMVGFLFRDVNTAHAFLGGGGVIGNEFAHLFVKFQSYDLN